MSSLTKTFRGLLNTAKKAVGGKVQVGQDARGNKYYLWYDRDREFPRRIVDYADEHYSANSNDIHLYWYQWLHRTRQQPPSDDEIRAFDADKEAMQARVRALDEADAKLRVQEQAERRQRAQEGRQEAGGAQDANARMSVQAVIDATAAAAVRHPGEVKTPSSSSNNSKS